MAYTHPNLTCWVCTTLPASLVMEAQADGESYFQACCNRLACLNRSAQAANAGDLVHVATVPLGGVSCPLP